MRVFCSICREIFLPSSEVKATNCGHLYHSSCIARWTERNKTCPKCRHNLKSQPFRVHLDVEQGEGADPSTLEHELEVVSDKLNEKDREVKSLKETNKNQEEFLAALRENLERLESKNDVLKGSLSVLKDSFSKELKKNTKLETELEVWMNKAKALGGLQYVLNGTKDAVDKMLENVPVSDKSVKQLCTYVQVLKEQIHVHEEKNSRLVKEKEEISRMLAEEKNKHAKEVKNDPRVVKLQNTITYLTDIVEGYKKKVEELEESKAELLERAKVPEKKVERKSDAVDIFLDDEEEEEPKLKKKKFKKLDVISNWENLVCAGPSKTYKRSRSFGPGYYPLSKSEDSRQSNYAFDGMGGSKKIVLPSCFEKPNQENKAQNKIYNYFLNNN